MQIDPNDKLMAYVAYIIFFVPLLTGTKSAFVKYHVNQGLVLLIASIALQFVLTFVVFIPVIGLILQLLRFVPVILWIMGLINVSNGEMKPLPIIGTITLIK